MCCYALWQGFYSSETKQKDVLNRNLLNYDLAESVFFEVATDDSGTSGGSESRCTVFSSNPIYQNIFGKWVDLWVFFQPKNINLQ